MSKNGQKMTKMSENYRKMTDFWWFSMNFWWFSMIFGVLVARTCTTGYHHGPHRPRTTITRGTSTTAPGHSLAWSLLPHGVWQATHCSPGFFWLQRHGRITVHSDPWLINPVLWQNGGFYPWVYDKMVVFTRVSVGVLTFSSFFIKSSEFLTFSSFFIKSSEFLSFSDPFFVILSKQWHPYCLAHEWKLQNREMTLFRNPENH